MMAAAMGNPMGMNPMNPMMNPMMMQQMGGGHMGQMGGMGGGNPAAMGMMGGGMNPMMGGQMMGGGMGGPMGPGTMGGPMGGYNAAMGGGGMHFEESLTYVGCLSVFCGFCCMSIRWRTWRRSGFFDF